MARRFESIGSEDAGGAEAQQTGGPVVTGAWQVEPALSAASRRCEVRPSKKKVGPAAPGKHCCGNSPQPPLNLKHWARARRGVSARASTTKTICRHLEVTTQTSVEHKKRLE
jgi:hypothetical protein